MKVLSKNKWPVWEPADVRRIRATTHLSQRNFCNYYGIDLKLLQAWERGLIVPDCAACLLLSMIKYNQYGVMESIDAIKEGEERHRIRNEIRLEKQRVVGEPVTALQGV